MKIKLLILCVTIGGGLLLCGDPFSDKLKLDGWDKAFYGAMKGGFMIGEAGGTEDDLQKVFLLVNAGDTNALQLWLNAQATNCPAVVRKGITLGWMAHERGVSVDEIIAMYLANKVK